MTLASTRSPSLAFEQVDVGTQLPELALPISATTIVAAALASRDFEPVHHDRTFAQASGMRDVFMNILGTNGFVLRFVTDWAGPEAIVQRASIRLGVPMYADDTLAFTGTVTAATSRDDGTGGVVEVVIRGSNSLGDHVTGTVEVDLPGGTA